MSWAKFERGNCLRWCPPCCFTDREGLELFAGVYCLSERRSSPGDIGGRCEAALLDSSRRSDKRRGNAAGRQLKGAERAGVQGATRTHKCCAGTQERSHFAAEVNVNAKLFATCLREAPSGSSPGPGGCTNEMLKVCLDNTEALHLLTSAAEDFARSSIPDNIFKAFTMATTSTSFRRLVANWPSSLPKDLKT